MIAYHQPTRRVLFLKQMYLLKQKFTLGWNAIDFNPVNKKKFISFL
jgi:hypothetical protein